MYLPLLSNQTKAVKKKEELLKYGLLVVANRKERMEAWMRVFWILFERETFPIKTNLCEKIALKAAKKHFETRNQNNIACGKRRFIIVELFASRKHCNKIICILRFPEFVKRMKREKMNSEIED